MLVIYLLVSYLSEHKSQIGIDLNTSDVRGYTMLTHAIHYNAVDAFSYLLQKGADYSVKDDLGHNLLHWAAYKGTEMIAIMLLNRNVCLVYFLFFHYFCCGWCVLLDFLVLLILFV